MVAFEAFAASAKTTGASISFGLASGAAKGILVYILINGLTDTVTGVTVDAAPMSEVPGSPLVRDSGAEFCQVAAFFLGSGIAVGAHTIVANFSGATDEKIAGAYSVTADNDTSLSGENSLINSTTLANPSSSLSLSGRDSFVSEAFHSGQGATSGISPLAGWTNSAEDAFTGAAQTAGFYQYDTVAPTDVTIGWTQTADDATCLAVGIYEIQPRRVWII